MRLEISQNLSNNRVKLDFCKNKTCPTNTPSYSIPEDRADEFIKKYNTQENSLKKITVLGTVIGGVVGALANMKKSVSKIMLGTGIGMGVALLAGVMFSLYKRNELMDKYKVERL